MKNGAALTPPAASVFEAAARGDGAAIEEIAASIRTIAAQICRGSGDASRWPSLDWQDVAQEASRRFFHSGLHQYRGTGREWSYLYSLVKATWIQLARSELRRSRREETWATERDSAPAPDVAVRLAARLKVERILSRLGCDCRELLEQVFLDGRSYEELAVVTGLAESSLRAKVSRCIRRARENTT